MSIRIKLCHNCHYKTCKLLKTKEHNYLFIYIKTITTITIRTMPPPIPPAIGATGPVAALDSKKVL